MYTKQVKALLHEFEACDKQVRYACGINRVLFQARKIEILDELPKDKQCDLRLNIITRSYY